MPNRSLPYLLTLPSLLLAAVVIFWPVWDLIQISTHDVNRFGQLRELNDFANFSALAADPDFIAALWRTGQWTVLVVGGALLTRDARALYEKFGFTTDMPTSTYMELRPQR